MSVKPGTTTKIENWWWKLAELKPIIILSLEQKMIDDDSWCLDVKPRYTPMQCCVLFVSAPATFYANHLYFPFQPSEFTFFVVIIVRW